MRTARTCEARDEIGSLITAVAAGDALALSNLHRATSARLIRTAMTITRRKEAAEDVVQDVFIKVWTRAASYDPVLGTGIGWLTTMTRNRALDLARRKSDRLVEAKGETPDVAVEIESPFEETIAPEAALKVVKSLSALDDERLQMLLLAYLFGWSRDDLARQFDRPVGTVKTWLRRSLAELRVTAPG